MEKILVIRYGTIGDTIFASAFYRELRKAMPNAQIDILADKIVREIMVNCPYIDNIIDIKGKYNNLFNYINIFKNYDTVYFLKNDSFFTLVAFLARVKNRIGFNVHRNKFLTKKAIYDERHHEIDCYLDLLRINGINPQNDKTELWLNPIENEKIKKAYNTDKPKVLIQAYSRFQQKNWIDKYWVKVIKYLSDELNCQIYFAGGAKDTPFYSKLTRDITDLKNPPIDTSGKLSVSETIALVNNMDMVIGIDSGIIHIAAALDIPSILLHGSTSLRRWKPRSEKCTVLSKYFPCSPCCLQSGTKKYCKNKTSKCMLKLTPDCVINLLKQQFKKSEKLEAKVPRISVIIPVFNVEKYISKCLDSIINQTLKDLEIICVDDGSSDYSTEIIKEYAKRDSRIKIIQQKNQGVSVARNTGIKNATGEFISFIDSDDWISPNFYEKMYFSAKELNADIAASSVMSVHRHYRLSTLKYNKIIFATDYADKIEICDIPDHCYVWNKIYKRETLLKSKLEFKPNMIYEDIIFTTKILYYAEKLITVPNTKYYYFRHKNTLVKTKNKKAKKDFVTAQQECLKFFNEKNIDVSHWETKTKKYKIFGLTVFKKITKNENEEKILLNCIKW